MAARTAFGRRNDCRPLRPRQSQHAQYEPRWRDPRSSPLRPLPPRHPPSDGPPHGLIRLATRIHSNIDNALYRYPNASGTWRAKLIRYKIKLSELINSQDYANDDARLGMWWYDRTPQYLGGHLQHVQEVLEAFLQEHEDMQTP